MSCALSSASSSWLLVQVRIDYKLSTICHNFFSYSSPACFSDFSPLPGSFTLLQTHRYFISPMVEQKPLANAVSPTVLQSNGICSPVNMSDSIHIRSGSGGKHWPEVGWMILAHQLDPFGQNLTQSARTKLDLGWFCTVLSGSSVDEWNQVQKSETGGGPVASCQKPGQMIPAHHFVSRCVWPNPDRPSRSYLCQFCTI